MTSISEEPATARKPDYIAALGHLALLVIYLAVQGFTVKVWWEWFVAGPEGAFPDLPSLTMKTALGLSLLVTALLQLMATVGKQPPLGDLVKHAAKVYASMWVAALAVHFLL